MIRTTEPIVYSTDDRTHAVKTGIVTEIVTNYMRMPWNKMYMIVVTFLVDGHKWKNETFVKTYAEIDALRAYVIANNDFGDLTGSELEDAILAKGLMHVAIQDEHFNITPDKWRFLAVDELVFANDIDAPTIPEYLLPQTE
jgi:hypothetical protein